MVKIRLARAGAKKRPFYHLVAADSRSPRDGRFIERLGFFNPIAVGGEVRIRVDTARVDHWVSNGAQLTERASKLVAEARGQLSLVTDDAGPDAGAAEEQAPAAGPVDSAAPGAAESEASTDEASGEESGIVRLRRASTDDAPRVLRPAEEPADVVRGAG